MMNILKIIFIIFSILYLFGEIVRFEIFNNFTLKPIDFFIFVSVFLWAISRSRDWKKYINFHDPFFLPILLFITILFLSLAINFKGLDKNEIFVSVSYSFRWIMYACLYFIVKSLPLKSKGQISSMLLILGSVIVFLGFIQYFLYPNLRNLYYLGWDEHMYRMFSIFLDPNFAGAFFVLFFIFSTGNALYYLKNNKTKLGILTSLISVFTLFSIFLTFSRSSLIMLLVSTIIFSAFAKKIKLFLSVLFIIIFFIIASSRNFHIENMNLFRVASSEARIDSYKIALDIIEKNLLFGVGFNAYRYAQIDYGFRSGFTSRLSHADAGTDNSFLFVFATTGIVGLVLYLNLFRVILKKSYLNFVHYDINKFQKYLSLIIIASLCGIMVNSFFINSLFYSFILIWIWILLGLMENK